MERRIKIWMDKFNLEHTDAMQLNSIMSVMSIVDDGIMYVNNMSTKLRDLLKDQGYEVMYENELGFRINR